ncbi:MAG: endo-1,4-beta-xylanase [Candidatus Saccharibacteria bacterium]
MKRTIKKNKLSKKLLVILIPILVTFILIGYWFLDPRAPLLPTPPIKDLSSIHGIETGVHVVASRLNESPYTDIVKSQFSFLTIDGEAHWKTLRPSVDKYNYAKADQMINFAEQNNMSVQVHHLMWGDVKFLPDWLKNGNYSQEQLLNMAHEHISNVMNHFKGKVDVWTVVNEAFTRNQHVYGLKDWWAENTGGGTRYIDDSFIWAHQTDPSAKLIINDFNNETENSVSNAEFSYLVSAKSRDIPIDGIGMQMHINATNPPSKNDVIKNIKRFAAIGLPTYITEFDVNLNSVKGSDEYKNKLEIKITYDMVRACIESESCKSFDEFGVTEKGSLFKKLTSSDSHSFLFNSRYNPKDSFYAFRDAWLKK